MRLFKKRENKKTRSWPANKLLEGIGIFLSKIQQAWAKWMEHRTENLNHNQWLMVLGLFVLLTGGYSSYLISASVLSKGKMVFAITSIQRPITATPEGKNKPAFVLTKKEYQKINRFRLYMDSLKRNPEGKMEYNKIILHRPGLMDSLGFIETYYRSQIKN